MGTLGWPELIIILVLAVLIFGGTRLAGLGRASGRAIREFKEETRGLKEEKKDEAATQVPPAPQATQASTQQVVEGEVVDPNTPPQN